MYLTPDVGCLLQSGQGNYCARGPLRARPVAPLSCCALVTLPACLVGGLPDVACRLPRSQFCTALPLLTAADLAPVGVASRLVRYRAAHLP